MNRRSFLLSASAAALATALPAPVLAMIPTASTYPTYTSGQIELLGMIEQALDVGAVYQFDIRTQATFFGLMPDVASNLSELRGWVHKWIIDYGSRDMRARLDFLIGIREVLDRRFGRNNIGKQIAWMRKPDPMFDVMGRGRISLADLMVTTKWYDLSMAAAIMVKEYVYS